MREIVCSVLHTVLFGRALGPVRPKDVLCNTLDVTYVHCGDKGVQREVDDRAEQLVSYLQRRRGVSAAGVGVSGADGGGGAPLFRVVVTVSFYEKKVKQNWFTKQQEKKYWEQWRVPIAVTDMARPGPAVEKGKYGVNGGDMTDVEAVLRRGTTRSQLQHCLLTAAGLLSEHRDHIPPVCSSDALSFPVEILIPCDSEPGYGSFDMLKKMLHSTPGLI